jgi:hypothetical protein
MKDNKWARLPAYVTGLVNQKLLLQNEYLIAENGILRAQLPQRLQLTDPQRSTLAEIGKRLGRKALGRPPVSREVVDLIVRMARENRSWGYDRIVGALSNLGHSVCDQTVGNILRRHGIAPAPKRNQTTTWKDFIAAHMAILSGVDFFTVEVLT